MTGKKRSARAPPATRGGACGPRAVKLAGLGADLGEAGDLCVGAVMQSNIHATNPTMLCFLLFQLFDFIRQSFTSPVAIRRGEFETIGQMANFSHRTVTQKNLHDIEADF